MLIHNDVQMYCDSWEQIWKLLKWIIFRQDYLMVCDVIECAHVISSRVTDGMAQAVMVNRDGTVDLNCSLSPQALATARLKGVYTTAMVAPAAVATGFGNGCALIDWSLHLTRLAR